MNGIAHHPKYRLGQHVWFVQSKHSGVIPVIVTKIASELRTDKSITDVYHIQSRIPNVGNLEGAYETSLGLTPEEALMKVYGVQFDNQEFDEECPFEIITKKHSSVKRSLNGSASPGLVPA